MNNQAWDQTTDDVSNPITEGFFNPMDLLHKNDVFKRLRHMSPENLYRVMVSSS